MTKELLQLLNNSKQVYDQYIASKKIFLHTKKLRQINKKILDIINSSNFEKEQKLEKPILDLRKHLEEWIVIWDRQQIAKSPSDEDLFVFSGYKKYPKGLELLLINTLK